MIKPHIQETIANLYSNQVDDRGVIPAIEAAIEYETYAELSTAGIDTTDARESILTGYASFAGVELPDPKNLSPEQLLKVQTAIVKNVLQSGVNGFKDGIEAIEFDNGNPLKGSFTERGAAHRTFSYEISQSGGNYTSTIGVLSGVED